MATVNFKMNVAELERSIREAVARSLDLIAIDLQRDLKVMLSRPGTGKRYRRSRGRRGGRNARERGFHIASEPGQPPAADTGTLRNSWGVGRRGSVVDKTKARDKLRPTLRLGSAIKYAGLLESGTVKMDPRPYVAPTIEAYVASGGPQRRVGNEIAKVLVKLRRVRP